MVVNFTAFYRMATANTPTGPFLEKSQTEVIECKPILLVCDLSMKKAKYQKLYSII